MNFLYIRSNWKFRILSLLEAKEDLEAAVEKYTDLYDFAPTGYLTLSMEGQIYRIESQCFKDAWQRTQRLINNLFGAFVTDDTKQKYYNFLKEIFNTRMNNHVK